MSQRALSSISASAWRCSLFARSLFAISTEMSFVFFARRHLIIYCRLCISFLVFNAIPPAPLCAQGSEFEHFHYITIHRGACGSLINLFRVDYGFEGFSSAREMIPPFNFLLNFSFNLQSNQCAALRATQMCPNDKFISFFVLN